MEMSSCQTCLVPLSPGTTRKNLSCLIPLMATLSGSSASPHDQYISHIYFQFWNALRISIYLYDFCNIYIISKRCILALVLHIGDCHIGWGARWQLVIAARTDQGYTSATVKIAHIILAFVSLQQWSCHSLSVEEQVVVIDSGAIHISQLAKGQLTYNERKQIITNMTVGKSSWTTYIKLTHKTLFYIH